MGQTNEFAASSLIVRQAANITNGIMSLSSPALHLNFYFQLQL